jgi:2-polyprenyl-3-methyl-5-hydroxy-6-metoxy-1,4-benzoquinol methylase
MDKGIVQGFSTMADSIEFANNYHKWIISKMKPYLGGNILEIGTGKGNYYQYLAKKYKSYISLDIDKEVIETAKKKYPHGIFIQADITSDEIEKFFLQKLNSIIIVNVLEHIKNHEKAIENLFNILQPNGYLIILVPAFNFLFNDLDRLAGHERRYSKSEIAILLKKHGAITKLEYFNPLGGLFWWINKFKRHKNINSQNINFQIKVFDKIGIYVSRFTNLFLKKFFGQSVFCVIQKL